MIKQYILFKFGLLVLGFIVILVIMGAGVFADSNIKHIGIEYSTVCKKLIESGDFETCGDPYLLSEGWMEPKLKPTFQRMFDDSKQDDKTFYQKNDILLNHKKSCIRENYCNVFNNYGSVYFWHDFDNEIRSYMDKVITINAHMKHTNLNIQNQEVFINATSRTLILDTNQINIKACHVIAYTPNNYRFLLEFGALMWHILDDCKDWQKLGILGEPYKKTLELSNIPVSESPAWEILRQAELLKAKYKEYRIGLD